jgi:hypothetical protein
MPGVRRPWLCPHKNASTCPVLSFSNDGAAGKKFDRFGVNVLKLGRNLLRTERKENSRAS